MRHTVYIRTDMNQTIATGHIMRCLAIADAVEALGGEPVFLVADRQAEQLLTARGYRYYILNSHWDQMEEELDCLREIILEEGIEKILVDSYQVTEKYLKQLAQYAKIVFIDDLHLFEYPVDEIICYANYYRQFAYNCTKYNALYLGTKYAPLRQAFYMNKKKQIEDNIRRILICSGGSDCYRVVETLLGKLKDRYEWIDAICGRYSDSFDTLNETYHTYNNIRVLRTVDDMESYMGRADVAISAGGTTLYELCAVGTPTISYAIADNQLMNVEQFHEDGIISYAGDVRKEDISSNILYYLEQYREADIRQAKSKKMQELVDGKGALRIAELLLNGR